MEISYVKLQWFIIYLYHPKYSCGYRVVIFRFSYAKFSRIYHHTRSQVLTLLLPHHKFALSHFDILGDNVKKYEDTECTQWDGVPVSESGNNQTDRQTDRQVYSFRRNVSGEENLFLFLDSKRGDRKCEAYVWIWTQWWPRPHLAGIPLSAVPPRLIEYFRARDSTTCLCYEIGTTFIGIWIFILAVRLYGTE